MDQLERHHSNGPRSVSPGGVFRDLMVNKDLPVEQAIQRDQISCHQPVRGGVCSTSPGGEGYVVCASKAESLTSTAAEQLLVCRLRGCSRVALALATAGAGAGAALTPHWRHGLIV